LKTETIKDKNNNIVGTIETDYKGHKILRDKEGKIIAYYYPMTDTSKDEYHNDIGKGDILKTLLGKKN